MNERDHAHLEVGLCEDVLYAKAFGLITRMNCMCFRDFANHALDEGCRRIIIDLQKCRGMDSTFLGIIAGLAIRETSNNHEIIVINANEENRKNLQEVGIDQFATVREDAISFPEIELQPLDEEQRSPIEKAEFVRAAHENLIKINDRNREKYGSILKAFTEQLAKKKAQSE